MTRPPSSLRNEGFVVLPALIEAEAIAGLRERVDDAATTGSGPSCERLNNILVPMRWCSEVVDEILSRTQAMSRVRAATGAGDLRWISGYVTRKPPRSRALAWHQDWWCWDHPVSFRRDPPQVALLVYLTRTDHRSGALRVLPGSHRASTHLHSLLRGAAGHGAAAVPDDNARTAGQSDELTLSLFPGDDVVLDYRLQL
jgi:hypothetical protein